MHMMCNANWHTTSRLETSPFLSQHKQHNIHQPAPNLSHRLSNITFSAHRLVPPASNRTFHHNFPSPLLVLFYLYFFLLVVGVRTFFVSKRILVVATIILVLGKFIRIIEKRIIFGCIFNMERASANPSSYGYH
jgi:hypothetical protein